MKVYKRSELCNDTPKVMRDLEKWEMVQGTHSGRIGIVTGVDPIRNTYSVLWITEGPNGEDKCHQARIIREYLQPVNAVIVLEDE